MSRRHRGGRATAAAVALILVVAGTWFGFRELSRPACSGEVKLSVAAAPEIAPAVSATVQAWEDANAKGGACAAVEVTSADPADVAAAIAGKHGATLTGVGQASGTTPVPDVWIPDSSTWLLRLSAAASGYTPGDTVSVAMSPVVVAMPQPVANAMGWPDKQLTWSTLMQKMTTDTQLRAGIVDPARDASGLSGLLALASAAKSLGSKAQEATTGILRALATERSALRGDLLARFPRSTDPATVASALGAAVLSEQAVIAYNKAEPPVPLAAAYLDPAPVPMDYPYTVTPGLDQRRADLANQLLAALSGQQYADRLAAAGLRNADGTVGNGFTVNEGAPKPPGPAPAPVPVPSAGPEGTAAAKLDPAVVSTVLRTWLAITLPARMLAVIDVSGSMKEPVPTAGNATREQVTIEAARRGLGLFDDSWAVGLWTFSTNLDGAKDYRQLVPIGPLSTQRTAVLNALSGIQPTGGDTGLYDTVLAAYKTVLAGWDPGRVNSVVLMTDGKNDDANGISLDKLLSDLKSIADPKKPIQMIIIGIGTGVDPQELQKITKAVGGGVFIAEDPSKIGEIFLQAIALRSQTK